MLVIVTIACFIGFDPFISASIPVFIIWPLAIVPFIYGFAFFFEKAGTAQFFIIFSQIFIMLCITSIVHSLRQLSETEYAADVLMWFCRLLPSYPIANTLFVEASCKTLFELRNYTKDHGGTAVHNDLSPWHIRNSMGDFMM